MVDSDLAGAHFTSSVTIGLKTRYWTTIYVFKFYDSDNVYFHCEVLVCPEDGSFNCNAAVSNFRLFLNAQIGHIGIKTLNLILGTSAHEVCVIAIKSEVHLVISRWVKYIFKNVTQISNFISVS